MLARCAISGLAHHTAADIVDQDIYATTDSLVADTPHVDPTFEQVITVTADGPDTLSDVLDDGARYIEELDGTTDIKHQSE